MAERGALADFLRARREALRPEDVGLPGGGRRRTPGLRREEVATLAGVSIDYLVRLEQGRDLHPSAEVLHALAEALRLGEEDRNHLKWVGAVTGNRAMCPAAQPLDAEVAPTVRSLLDGLDPTPAFVLGTAGDVLAWNATWAALVAPLELLPAGSGRGAGPAHPPNLVAFVFGDPRAQRWWPNWPAVADAQVRRLRAAALEYGDDERFRAVVDGLSAEPEFARRWAEHAVATTRRGVELVDHPALGRLRLAFDVLHLPEATQQLITWQPADAATAAALERLRPAVELRLVGEA